MRNTYVITEYGSFVAEKQIPGYTTLSQRTFDALEAFVLANRGKDADALELLALSARKGIGKIITASNYVGVITMTDGTTIEILPKVFPIQTKTAVKKLLINMLRSLRDSPYKTLQTSYVNVEKLNIFEVFIRMFVDEVLYIEKRGLKSGYQTVQSNEAVFKGKLKVSEHIKYNFVHKERSFVEYDTFHIDRPENRLIKTCLLHLYRISQSAKNRVDIKNLLNSFAEVSASADITGDFEKCVPGRNMKDYATALLWCRVFLLGKSFSAFSGSEIAFALLFPMETLFESYVAQQLRKYLDPNMFTVSAQDRSCHLFDNPRQFLMKPDLVVKRKQDGAAFILDTKWKLLAPAKASYGISQADMYQMYAYQKKYQAESVTLLYPATDTLMPDQQITFQSDDGVLVTARFVDLFDLDRSFLTIIPEP